MSMYLSENRKGAQHCGCASVCRLGQPGREVMDTTDTGMIVYMRKTGKMKPPFIVREVPRSGAIGHEPYYSFEGRDNVPGNIAVRESGMSGNVLPVRL